MMKGSTILTGSSLILFISFVLYLGCGGSENRVSSNERVPENRNNQTYSVGVAQTNVNVKIDLTDKLNPAILPDVMREVLEELAPTEKPDSQKFQQDVVRKLSHKIISNTDINYQVDLNEDANLDPLLVVPESVQGEAAIYSIRVPDPTEYPKDPAAYDVDWDQVAKDGIELVALSITFDQTSQQMVIGAEANAHTYEGRPNHYRRDYHSDSYSWMGSYLRYMVIRDILFSPYSWYGGGWYGGWYPRYYGGWHSPVATRTVTRTRTITRYKNANPAQSAPSNNVRSSRAKNRTQAPKAIQQMKSKRTMAARQKASGIRSGGFGRQASARRSTSTTTNRAATSSPRKVANSRSGGFPGRTSSRGSSFRGGSRSFGK